MNILFLRSRHADYKKELGNGRSSIVKKNNASLILRDLSVTGTQVHASVMV
jgi:hypothetical protein